MMINKLRVKFILGFAALVLWGGALADKGVFNPKITPIEAPTNTPTTVTITAEIGTDAAHPPLQNSIIAYETDAAGKPIRPIGQLYDDGTHGDATPADTIFTIKFNVNDAAATKKFIRVTAAYSGIRNRYQSPVVQLEIFEPIPVSELESANVVFTSLQTSFDSYVQSMDIDSARQRVYQDAIGNPNITNAEIHEEYLSVVFKGRIQGIVEIGDPKYPIKGAGRSTPINLPDQYKNPGNDKLMIFAPEYNGNPPLTVDSDHALSRFSNAEYMSFTPSPIQITKDENANLEVVKSWGNYGAVIVDTHGGIFTIGNVTRIGLRSGTPFNATTSNTYNADFSVIPPRVYQSTSGKIGFYPEFISANASSMKDTFF